MQKRIKLGWIGAGIMGKWMCFHCIKSDKFHVYVHSRTISKCVFLAEQGATVCESLQDLLFQDVDVLVSIVSFPKDVEQILTGADGLITCYDNKIIQRLPIFVDMSTNKPEDAIKYYKLFKERGSYFVDAPVSGGEQGAQHKRLSVMAGGDLSTFQYLNETVFCSITDTKNNGVISYMGDAGSGQKTKIVNQILIASNMIGVCEGLLYAVRGNFADPYSILKVVESGAAGSWSLSNLGPKILKQDFSPGFVIEHFIKDMQIALEDAERLGLTLPGLKLAHELYSTYQEGKKIGAQGTQALFSALEQLSKKRKQQTNDKGLIN